MVDAQNKNSCNNFPKKERKKDVIVFASLNMTEGILTKNNWLWFPPKPEEAKLVICI